MRMGLEKGSSAGRSRALSFSLLPLIWPEFESYWPDFERVLFSGYRNSSYYFAPGTARLLIPLPPFFKPQHNLK